MKARYLVVASLAAVLLSGCANEEKPVAPSDDTTSLVESTVESGGSSHIEITPSANSSVFSTQSSSAANPADPYISEFALGTTIRINGEIFDSKWSFEEAKENGWEYEPSTAVVKPNEVGAAQILLTKGDKKVYVTVFNASETDKVASDCEIIGAVSFNEMAMMGNEDAELLFFVGQDLSILNLMSNRRETIQSYRGYESFTVPTDEGILYHFTYDDTSKVASIGMTHKASNGQPLLVENPEEPDVSPFAFGTAIRINGEIFDSEWSFEEAKSHGWEYEPSTAVIKPNEVGAAQILLTKGDKKVYVTVYNVTDTDKVATDCEIIGAVCSIEGAEIGNDDAFIDFKVGGDLKRAYAVMGPVTRINSYRGYESFTVPTDEGSVYHFTYDSSNNPKLTSVGVTHKASNGQTFAG